MKSVFLVISCFLLFSLSLQAADMCLPTDPAGERCQVLIQNLLPTQSNVGLVDVNAKRAEITARSGKRLVSFLKDNRAEVVIGPGGKFYIIDRHHLTQAAFLEGQERMYAEVVENLSSLSPTDFWRQMERRGWVRLRNTAGAVVSPAQLPQHIRNLTDDPYRSLAWVVRQSGAFEKTEIPFAEFEWGDFFRRRIPESRLRSDWNGAVKEAIALTLSPEAKSLPGYVARPPKAVPTAQRECWQAYEALPIRSP